VDEQVQYLEQIHKEVMATLLIAAQEMRNSGPPSLTHTFQQNDQVLLEATNLQSTHVGTIVIDRNTRADA